MRTPRIVTAAVTLIGVFAYGFLFGEAKARGDRPLDPQPQIVYRAHYLPATAAQVDQALIAKGALPPPRPHLSSSVQDRIDACEEVNETVAGAKVDCTDLVAISDAFDKMAAGRK